jgi:hypothetical protein
LSKFQSYTNFSIDIWIPNFDFQVQSSLRNFTINNLINRVYYKLILKIFKVFIDSFHKKNWYVWQR